MIVLDFKSLSSFALMPELSNLVIYFFIILKMTLFCPLVRGNYAIGNCARGDD